MTLQPNYIYKAVVDRFVDGDTVDVDLDVGFKMWFTLRLRLNRLNTPETNSKDPMERMAGLKVKQRLNELLNGKEVVVMTHKQEKYGRYLAEVYYVNDAGIQVNLNDELLASGEGVSYDGGAR